MFDTVLVANRGVIACRIMRTLRAMGLRSVAVYSQADKSSAHVAMADAAVCIGPAPAAQSYLNVDAILRAARDTGAGAIHPGYGFLSESADFAEACAAAGIAFIGPTPAQLRAFGRKHTARALAAEHGVPLLPGSALLADLADAQVHAARIGYPVMLKSTAGGGGIGMRLVASATELPAAWDAVERLARGNFDDAGLFVEKFVERARHIEVQLFGDGHGTVIALGERDCSAQRRNQKVIEETPAPHLADATRTALLDAAVRLGSAVQYRSAGTVEFVLDADSGAFYFLEVNTRLQVEHGVTEEVTGIDLVAWMVQLARDGHLPLAAPVPRGAAIQVRLYAENPARQFQPCPGLLTEVVWPAGVRIETWVETGSVVPPHYDPMIGKLIVHAPTRDAAVQRLREALAATRLAGIETNLRYLRAVVADPVFAEGRVVTRTLGDFRYTPTAIEVLEPGLQTTLQDWPGRRGYWSVGVPPSGPMDSYAHRLANRLVGNAADVATLECNLAGPRLQFHVASVIAVTGADVAVMLDGAPLPMWRSHRIAPGAVVTIGRAEGSGSRVYLAVGGGIDVPHYLGSRATFTLGQFGGQAGRPLLQGDMLHLLAAGSGTADVLAPPALIPAYARSWHIGVFYGPHGAPDFFLPEDIAGFFASDWAVHYNSSRTGVRLIGPKPRWARTDGGEAGLHPSNIHDNAYAIGAVDFTGDMPVVLGPDGPSLGGFVCPAVVVDAELWKLGQLRAGDTVRFHRLTGQQAAERSAQIEHALAALTGTLPAAPVDEPVRHAAPILAETPATETAPRVVYRQAGDRYLLVEFGPLVLDIELRLRAHSLLLGIEAAGLPGIVDLTPGIRSLQLHYDPARIAGDALLTAVSAIEAALPPAATMVVASRIVHLPLAWDDAQTRLAIDKYMTSVRPDAPWCPSNLEFIRRINGLATIDDVRALFFDASYLVLGLGDVYLGAPVATPIDPRHRLVTTKYNPARTWTPENAVGIGGAYLCVYGMEGPGGYQFVGRTVQMWNRWRHGGPQHGAFSEPWLLRPFDQLRFYPVAEDELLRLRDDFPAGRTALRIEPTTFDLASHRRFLADHAEAIARFKATQQAAFDAERERWRAAGEHDTEDADIAVPPPAPLQLSPDAVAVTSPAHGCVSKVVAAVGDWVAAGSTVLIVEAMKMEFEVTAPAAGQVVQVVTQDGASVVSGQELMVLRRGAPSQEAP